MRSLSSLTLCGLLACSSLPREAPPALAPSLAPAPPPLPVALAPEASPPGGDEPPAPGPAPEEVAPPALDTHVSLEGQLGRVIEVYPPLATGGKKPMVVFLHATCMQPGPVCDAFGTAGRDAGWLVCPAGNSTCYGEPDWGGPGATKAEFLEQAMLRAEERIGDHVEKSAGVLVGWSRGAYAARDILMVRGADPKAQRFSGLVLIAASVPIDAALLSRAGIQRAVFAAGDFDGARGAMEKNSARLKAAGVEARYVSLGKIGHWWPRDFEERMAEPIRWAAGERPVSAPEAGAEAPSPRAAEGAGARVP